MLLRFKCSNFASIRDEAVLSLEPSGARNHPENLLKSGEYTALSEIAIYGANASGKSSLLTAMSRAVSIIRDSSVRQAGEPVPVVPFCLDDESPRKPSRFEFTFTASDGKKYIYGFSADIEAVREEHLCLSSPKGGSLMFRRTGDSYEFPGSLRAELSQRVRMNTPNKLFLATAACWNAKSVLIPYCSLSGSTASVGGAQDPSAIALELYRSNPRECAEFAKELLRQADLELDDILAESEEAGPFGSIMAANGILAGGMSLGAGYRTKITTVHAVRTASGNTRRFRLRLSEEAAGTKRLIFLAPIIKDALDSGKTLLVDDLDRSLHPALVRFLADIFRSHSVNQHGAQLIFTSHETSLLSENILRPDQVYFTEKSPDTEATSLYSLGKFRPGNSDRLEKEYLQGRFGAVPRIKAGEPV